MAKLLNELVSIVMAGAVVTVDAKTRLASELVTLARAAAVKDVDLRIINAGSKLTTQLREIAQAGNGHVIFVDAM